MEEIAKVIIGLYKNPQINNKKEIINNHFGEKNISNDLANIPGYTNLNIILRHAIEFYSIKDKEIVELKIKIAHLSAHIDKLKKIKNNNTYINEEIETEYELENAKKKLVNFNKLNNKEIINKIKQGFNILLSNNSNSKLLHRMITENIINNYKININIIELKEEKEIPELIKEDNNKNVIIRYYKYKNGEIIKQVFFKKNVFNEGLKKQNLFINYLNEKNKPWIKGMTFDEWKDFKDEIAYENDYYNEL